MSLSLWSPAAFRYPLPDGHRFPATKYTLLAERVVSEGLVPAGTVATPDAADDDALRRVHDAAYLRALHEGTLDVAAVRRLGFPWSAALVERAARAVGGTMAASRHALAHGIAMNLSGGTHHAFAGHGEGFCVFNDVAVALRDLRHASLARRAAVIDLDVHQGNGTHAIFAGDADTYTFSMHGAKNFPFHKVAGTLDIALPDRITDEPYLALLADALPRVLRDARADVVFYLAGADPHEGDSLGRLALTFDGLRRRDRLVIQSCREIGLPVVIVIAGGYGKRIDDTVAVHLGTVAIAVEFA
jgi:acetoin utilization deacetylase AcuC-like enzyme